MYAHVGGCVFEPSNPFCHPVFGDSVSNKKKKVCVREGEGEP